MVRAVFNREDFEDFKKKLGNSSFSELDYNTAISIYLDDMHLHTKTFGQHFHLLNWVLLQARKFDLRLNSSKCEVLTSDVECLGAVITRKEDYSSFSV